MKNRHDRSRELDPVDLRRLRELLARPTAPFRERAVLEWDFYLDHTDRDQIKIMQQAMAATGEMIEKFSAGDPRILWIRYLFNQGFSRKESFLYPNDFSE